MIYDIFGMVRESLVVWSCCTNEILLSCICGAISFQVYALYFSDHFYKSFIDPLIVVFSAMIDPQVSLQLSMRSVPQQDGYEIIVSSSTFIRGPLICHVPNISCSQSLRSAHSSQPGGARNLPSSIGGGT